MKMNDFMILGAYLLLVLLSTELLSKTSLKKVMMLRWYNSLLSMLLFLDLVLLFEGLSGSFRSSLQITTATAVGLALAGKIKLDYRQTGFTPIDFLILKEAGSMAGALNIRETLKLAASALLALGLLFTLSLKVPEISLSPTLQLWLIIANGLLAAASWLLVPLFNYRLSVYRTGVLPYFFAYLRDPVRLDRKPSNIPDIDLGFHGIKDPAVSKPDILIIQSESFADPTLLGMDLFNRDPLPFYRKLKEESLSFDMATRAFGGGTVHTEYEILTGLSSIFFPRDTTVFSRYLKKPLVSLGSILAKQGYQPRMIHPYLDWYYNRNKVYRSLGFEEFRTLRSFKDPGNRYVPDREVHQSLLDSMTGEHNFVFGVTMQNHTPYKERVFTHGLRFLGHLENRETKEHFDNYLNGLRETDLALEELINVLRQRERETILLFYGDHLPVINQDADFYSRIGWSKNVFDSREYAYDLSLSPALIWSNKRNLHKEQAVVDCSLVLPLLLKQTSLDCPDYLQSLDRLRENDEINGLFRDFLVSRNKVYPADTAQYKLAYNAFRRLNSDVFYGSRYESWQHVSDAYKIN